MVVAMVDKKLIPALLLTLVNTLGFSLLIPVLPFMVKDYGASEIVFGILLSAYSLFQFLATPFLGVLSDYWGRKPVLLITQLGTLLSWVLFAAAAWLDMPWLLGLSLSIWVIGLARVTDGITGGNTSVTNAYISDITANENKTASFGIQGAVFGAGMIIGPVIGGFTMSTSWGFLGTALFAILLSTVTLFSIALFLQESLAPEHRRKTLDKNILYHLNVWAKLQTWKNNRTVQKIMQLRFIFGFILASFTSIITLYLIDAFTLNEKQISYFLVFVGGFMIFNQVVVVKRVVHKIGDFPTLLLGLGLMVLGLILMPRALNIWQFTFVYYFENLGVSFIIPTVLSVLTRQVSKSEQGEITGLVESLSALSLAIAPLMASWGYFYLKGEIFLVFGVITAAALAWFWWGYVFFFQKTAFPLNFRCSEKG